MGQVPAKYFSPQAPYGSSQATNTANTVQAQATNPQTPLLPPNFTDPGTMPGGLPTPAGSQLGIRGMAGGGANNNMRRMFGIL